MIDWLDAFLISGLIQVVMVIGLALLLHLQLGLARIANFGVVGFWGIGMYTFGVLYVQVDWPFGEPWQFLICAAAATLVAGLAGLLVGWLIAALDTDGVLVGTLGFATAVQILATTEDDYTGGARGMGGLDFPFDIGRVKANALLWLFVVGSAGMGLLGAMNGVMVHYLDVGNVGVGVTLAAMVGLVLGGTARVWVGVILTVGLFDIVVQSYLPLPKEWYSQAIPVLREAAFGLTLMLVLLFRPLGLRGDMRRD